MKMQKIVFVLIGLMLFFAGKASAQQVKTDYDRSANFAQYKTYSWEHVKTQDALDVDRIKSCSQHRLRSKRVDSGGFRRRCLHRCHGNHPQPADLEYLL